jgi:hypothetical protein
MKYKKGFTSWKGAGLKSGHFSKIITVPGEEFDFKNLGNNRFEPLYRLKLMGNKCYKKAFLFKGGVWWEAEFIFTQKNK